MKFDLARMRKVLGALGNPQQRFPAAHIAGTNGKGSVSAMVANSLRLAGVKVGLYTSPHLERVNERFQVNGRQISDADLSRLSRKLIRLFPHLTQFEFLTTIAFVWFAEQKVDVAVVETGLGGRLDATNAMSRVLVSAITNIDFDHMNWLGRTLEKIAGEKAGIIKRHVPVVSGAPQKVIAATARRRHAPLLRPATLPRSFKLLLLGAHQRKNAAVAISILRTLKQNFPQLSEKIIRVGISSAHWPGRFERFLLGSSQFRRTVVLDGAHNEAGCRVLARTLKDLKLAPVHLLFGVLKDKDISAMVKILSPVAASVVVSPVSSERSADPTDVASMKAWRGRALIARSVQQAWEKVLQQPGKRPIVVAGSLYLVGEIRRKLK